MRFAFNHILAPKLSLEAFFAGARALTAAAKRSMDFVARAMETTPGS